LSSSDGSRLQDVTEKQFDFVFGVNTKGRLLTVQKSLPLLASPASVILLASSIIHLGTDRMGIYVRPSTETNGRLPGEASEVSAGTRRD
jgi:NAD(P)-dependent dehydrogenase (short-subunit alcohol dehydrogenase family)